MDSIHRTLIRINDSGILNEFPEHIFVLRQKTENILKISKADIVKCLKSKDNYVIVPSQSELQ